MRVWLSLLLLPTAFVGCTICPPGYLDDYATIGGRYQRLDPTTGRVGSAFSDPGTQEVALDGYYADTYATPAVEQPYIVGETEASLPGTSVIETNSLPTDPPSFELQDGIILESVEAAPSPGNEDILQGSGSR